MICGLFSHQWQRFCLLRLKASMFPVHHASCNEIHFHCQQKIPVLVEIIPSFCFMTNISPLYLGLSYHQIFNIKSLRSKQFTLNVTVRSVVKKKKTSIHFLLIFFSQNCNTQIMTFQKV